jgi:hypothetical protein
MQRYLAATALLLWVGAGWAQTNRGGIAGTVSDKSGATVPGATITVTSAGTNETFRTITSEGGVYSIANLDPVLYRVEVAAHGFQKRTVDRVKVDTANVTTLNFQLDPGTVQTEVTVSADPPVLNTESGTAAQTVTELQIDNAPLVNRSVLDLAILIPNVSGDPNSEDPSFTSGATVPGYNLSVNGGRAGSTLIMADGVNNTGVGIARSVVTFSPETVQEFTVQTNAFSAEYSRTGGGVINSTTKSGTNQLHGTALWYQRNPSTNAAPFTTAATNRPVSNTRSNQFSLAAGGPVVIPKVYNGRNKTFFFGAVEPRYLTDHLTGYGTMPTDAMRQGDFSNTVKTNSDGNDLVPIPASVAAQFPGIVTYDATNYNHYGVTGNQFTRLATPSSGQTYVPFPNNVIPQNMLDPVTQKLMQYLPKPNSPWFISPSGNLSNLVGQRNLTDNNVRYTARIDQVIGSMNRLYFRGTVVPVVGSSNYGNPVNGASGNWSSSKQMTVADTHTLGPRLVNDLRLNYTRGRFSSTFSPEFDARTGRNLSTELGLPSLTHGGLPQMQDGLGTYGWIGSGGSTLGDNVEERYNIADSVYLSRGRMSIKIGVDLTHELLNTVSLYQAAGGIYVFRNYQTNSTGASSAPGGSYFASFLLGVPNQVNLNNALLPYYYRWNSGAAYIQDDWKIRPNLTLNLGLRYQLSLPRTEKFNHQGTFLPGEAQSYPLAQPLTLADGETITSALVPPFALDAYGGRTPYLWPASYTDFEPRFGFAWSPKIFGLDRTHLVIRGGYGLSHVPLNGQNRKPMPSFSSPATTFGETSGQTNSSYAMRLGSNPPYDPALTWNQVLPVTTNGMITLGSLNYSGQAFAISTNMKTPYSQSWNFTLAWQPDQHDVIEIAYVGNKGTHLFMPQINKNSSDIPYINALEANNQSPTTTVPDPLGRVGSNGRVLTVQQGTLGSMYLGFLNLYTRYDSSANSIRHAGYINWLRRPGRGLTVTANYTFGKSIDDSSDSGPDDNILTTAKSISGGSSNFGGTRQLDRSVSTFDVKHSIVSSFLWDVPVGRSRRFFSRASKPLNAMFGNWTFSGVMRVRTGYPFMPVIRDNNGLGDNSSSSEYSMRPNIVSGVPVANPLWGSSCPLTNLCEPFVNPAAFERPVLGQLGNAPRTIDGARGPWQRYFDASVQKTFTVHERVRVQFRTDLLNAFNHPAFGLPTGYGGANSWNTSSGAPANSPLTAAQYDTWAAYNNQPLSTTSDGAQQLAQIQSFITGNRNSKGALPSDFWTVPVPTGFATRNPNSFDVRMLTGFKLYSLANTYNTTFGNLSVKSIPRYIQFGLKIYF